MPPNVAPIPTIEVRVAPISAVAPVVHSSPLDGSLGLFLVMLFVVLLLIAITGIILYRIHLRKPLPSDATTSVGTPPPSALRQLFLPSLVQGSASSCSECNTPTSASFPEQPSHTEKSQESPLSVKLVAFVSRCKLPVFASPTRTSNIPAIVVSSCSPLEEPPLRLITNTPNTNVVTSGPILSPSSSADSLQVPAPGMVKRAAATPTKPRAKPRINSTTVVSNTSGRPFELSAPPPALTGKVRRVSAKRHARNKSITSVHGKDKENVPPSGMVTSA